MADYYKIEIDVSPHVKKYITYNLSKNPLSFDFNKKVKDIKIDHKHHIGLIIINFLQKAKQSQLNQPAKKVKYNNKKIDKKINVSLIYNKNKGELNLGNSFYYLNKKRTKDLDFVLDKLFRQELFQFLDAYQMVRDLSKKTNEGLFIFYKKYNLTEEDLPVETILRDYRRYKRTTKHLGISYL